MFEIRRYFCLVLYKFHFLVAVITMTLVESIEGTTLFKCVLAGKRHPITQKILRH